MTRWRRLRGRPPPRGPGDGPSGDAAGVGPCVRPRVGSRTRYLPTVQKSTPHTLWKVTPWTVDRKA